MLIIVKIIQRLLKKNLIKQHLCGHAIKIFKKINHPILQCLHEYLNLQLLCHSTVQKFDILSESA